MRRLLIPFLLLMAVWLLLSGHYTITLNVLGVLSCIFALWLVQRLGAQPDWPLVLRVGARLLHYLPWLAREVVKSNLDLCGRIWRPSLPIEPQVIKVRADQRSGLGITLFANSITLTPGTLTLDVRPGEVEVHALSDVSARILLGGEMNRRVHALESEPGDVAP